VTLLRWSAVRERLRSSLWFWPSIAVVVALVAGVVLPRVEAGSDVATFGFSGTPEGARAVLATVAGSLITVTSLTFSLTVVALQVASSQFTPRLMGTFLADRGNQAVLSVFLGTFTYTLAVLPSVRSESEARGAFVPEVAVALGLALTLVSVAMLVYFIHHLTQQLRVEAVLAEVQHDALKLIRAALPTRGESPEPVDPPSVPQDAIRLRVRRGGYLQTVSLDGLRKVAVDHGMVVYLRPVVGTHLTVGSTLAWAWPCDGAAGGRHEGGGDGPVLDDDAVEDLARRLHDGVHIGNERTLQQDVAFSVRQLVDVAARALSPGINDPTTAVAALGAMSTVLVELVGRRLDPKIATDGAGSVRVVVDQPTFGEILALACDQPRRYGRAEPAVLTEVLHLLTDLAEVAHDDHHREAIAVQVQATVSEAEDAGMTGDPLDRVRTAARHAKAAIAAGGRLQSVPREVEEPAS
jgi:uncharacterized membrane protein